jgi:hypothetical protein
VGSVRSETFKTQIELVNVAFGDRVVFWLDDAGYWLMNLFS